MEKRIIDISVLSETQRSRFLDVIIEQLDHLVAATFRPDTGHLIVAEPLAFKGTTARVGGRWRVTKNSFWGLEIVASPSDISADTLQIRIDGFFPFIQKWLDRIERIDRLHELPWAGRLVVGHLLFPFLLIPGLLFVPFIPIYQLAKLVFRPTVRNLVHELDEQVSRMQGQWPMPMHMKRPMNQTWVYTAALAVTVGSTAFCAWAANLPRLGEWSTALLVTAWLLGFLSVVLVIAVILALLGFVE